MSVFSSLEIHRRVLRSEICDSQRLEKSKCQNDTDLCLVSCAPKLGIPDEKRYIRLGIQDLILYAYLT